MYAVASTSVCPELLGVARIVAQSVKAETTVRLIPAFTMTAVPAEGNITSALHSNG
jgi:hypothetical protein